MTFPDTTYLDVIIYLNKTIDDAEEVKTALAKAEENPEVETKVTEVLEQIATLNTSLLAEESSPNSAMIRADVVEWQPGQRSKGMVKSLNGLKRNLANLLGLEWVRPSSGNIPGVVSLYTRNIT